MTSVCRGRGILSLDKHVALGVAVTSWNGSWHKVAPQTKNKLWRYTTEQGEIQLEKYLSGTSHYSSGTYPTAHELIGSFLLYLKYLEVCLHQLRELNLDTWQQLVNVSDSLVLFVKIMGPVNNIIFIYITIFYIFRLEKVIWNGT